MASTPKETTAAQAEAISLNDVPMQSPYGSNADLQRSAALQALPMLRRAMEMAHKPCDRLTVVEYGSAHGNNTIEPVEVMLRLSGASEATLLLVDRPQNDFNALAKTVGDWAEARPHSPLFLAMIPRSFYRPVVPARSVDVGFSLSCLHHLDRLPADPDLMPAQARRDLCLFLRLRASEVVSGGSLVISLVGRSSSGRENHFAVTDACLGALRQMVEDGCMPGSVAAGFRIPSYERSMDEIRSALGEVSDDWETVDVQEAVVVHPARTELSLQRGRSEEASQKYAGVVTDWLMAVIAGYFLKAVQVGLPEADYSEAGAKGLLDEWSRRTKRLFLEHHRDESIDCCYIHILLRPMSQPIPQPYGVPLLGNILDINPNKTWQSLKALAQQHGQIFQLSVLGHTVVFIAGVELAGEVCDEKRFRKHVGGPIVEVRAAVNDGLFTAYHHEDIWGVAHRILAPPLQPKAVARLFPAMNDLTGELVDQWKSTSLPITPFDGLGRLTCEIIHQTLFGQRLNGLRGPEPPIIQAIKDFMVETVLRRTRPRLMNWLWHGSKHEAIVNTMRQYGAATLDWGKEHPQEREELLTAVMTGKDPETGKGLSDRQGIDNIVTMQSAGSTAPCLLTAALVYLLKNPETLAKARDEIDSVIGRGGELEHAHLAKLKYLEGVLLETLRMASPAPAFNVEPLDSQDKSPILLGGGKYQIAHDQPMIIVLSEVNHDPAVFEDAYSFKPERMMGESFAKLPDGARKWFGSGQRKCLGVHHAMQMCIVILARLLRDLDLEMTDPTYEPDMQGYLNVHPVGFSLQAKPRGR
ncbi:hypothetical protein L249_8510 [Ophiocordyceps polyrhachis-furcata BCC 54312]|uniref:Cytochrome P450 n=1 Tax=Ophiocordyceps polyrhachis-furcata BCC 54312 TaxID=1330021 RepID=A0A367L724_9HYPO|nr:hypothetical protein L249_8510 [Ophiocordyceps polyrhachis-furcata BCC 54312]